MCSIVAVINCRGLEPVISGLWGKGVTLTLARMDQFMYCTIWEWIYDFTGATELYFYSSRTDVALNLFGYATSPVLHTSRSNVSPPLLPLSIARHVL